MHVCEDVDKNVAPFLPRAGLWILSSVESCKPCKHRFCKSLTWT